MKWFHLHVASSATGSRYKRCAKQHLYAAHALLLQAKALFSFLQEEGATGPLRVVRLLQLTMTP